VSISEKDHESCIAPAFTVAPGFGARISAGKGA